MAINNSDNISPSALYNLPEQHYLALIDRIQDELSPPPNAHLSWQGAFSTFGLLAQSILGGYCWEGATAIINNLKWGDVKQILSYPLHEPFWIGVTRSRMVYPIFIAPPVHYALLLVTQFSMSQNSTRNNALSRIENTVRVTPPKLTSRELTQLQQNKLRKISLDLNLGFIPKLSEFRATSRWLMTKIYPLDIVHATLQIFEASSPDIEQIQSTGPVELITDFQKTTFRDGYEK